MSEQKSFVVETPVGKLLIEEKGAFDEYPGVFISLVKDDGIPYLVAAVEYETYHGELRTECYANGYEEPLHIINYETGRDLL